MLTKYLKTMMKSMKLLKSLQTTRKASTNYWRSYNILIKCVKDRKIINLLDDMCRNCPKFKILKCVTIMGEPRKNYFFTTILMLLVQFQICVIRVKLILLLKELSELLMVIKRFSKQKIIFSKLGSIYSNYIKTTF